MNPRFETFPSAENTEASREDFERFEEAIAPSLKELDSIIEEERGNPRLKERIKKVAGVVFKRILPLYVASMGAIYATQKTEGSFSEKDRAVKELEENGITSERASCYKPGISEITYRGVYPYSYNMHQNFDGFFERLMEGVEEQEQKGPRRYDAWRLYLGLPQKFNTFGISDYHPEHASEDKYYYKLNDVTFELPEIPLGVKDIVQKLKEGGGTIPWHTGRSSPHAEAANQDIMRNFTVSMGKDEKGHYISYYDKWDLAVLIESSGAVGEPYEIYDRIYYDPVTWQVLSK